MVESTHSAGFWPHLMEPLRQARTRIADWFAPASEAFGGQDTYRIVMELPGVAEDDIEISVNGHMVTVSGEKHTERADSGEDWFFSERQFGAFSRSFRLPPDADAGAMSADLQDGVLTVTVRKIASQPGQGARKVPINVL
jgi:HSP20 family protein